MKHCIRKFVALAVFCLFTVRAFGFCYEPKIRLDDEYFTSDIVFTGVIIADKKVGLTKEGFYDADLFSWRVDQALRGPLHHGQIIMTLSGNDSGRFPFEAAEGHQLHRQFLIFAFKDPSNPRYFAVDNCGNSIPLAEASKRLAVIRSLPSRHGGLLYGVMIDDDSNVTVVARGNGRTFTTRTGNRGTFQLNVPPGTYNVTATKPNHNYVDFDLAYKHSKSVQVPDGGSAGLAFREEGR